MRNRNALAGLAVLFMCSLGRVAAATTPVIPSAAPVYSTIQRYRVPPVTLIDQHGHEVRLDRALNGNKPVLVEFFFTTCTTICGVRSAQLVYAAPKFAKAGIDVGLYTISIDPEHDTPARLLAYSKKFGMAPPPNWHLLTGTATDVKKIEAAFGASDPSSDRMMHAPLLFIRGGKGRPWRRIDSVLSTQELQQQIQIAVAAAR